MRGTLPGAARSKYPKGYLGSLIRLRGASSLSGHDLRVVRVFGVANLACNLGTQARALTNERGSRSQ